jgi:hypothetical protein
VAKPGVAVGVYDLSNLLARDEESELIFQGRSEPNYFLLQIFQNNLTVPGPFPGDPPGLLPTTLARFPLGGFKRDKSPVYVRF